jgi:hypothetical protein
MEKGRAMHDVRKFALTPRNGLGLTCDLDGVALGPVVLATAGFDDAGQVWCNLAPVELCGEFWRPPMVHSREGPSKAAMPV